MQEMELESTQKGINLILVGDVGESKRFLKNTFKYGHFPSRTMLEASSCGHFWNDLIEMTINEATQVAFQLHQCVKEKDDERIKQLQYFTIGIFILCFLLVMQIRWRIFRRIGFPMQKCDVQRLPWSFLASKVTSEMRRTKTRLSWPYENGPWGGQIGQRTQIFWKFQVWSQKMELEKLFLEIIQLGLDHADKINEKPKQTCKFI